MADESHLCSMLTAGVTLGARLWYVWEELHDGRYLIAVRYR